MLQNNSTDIENFDNENVIDIDINHGNNNDFISLWHYGIDAYDSKEYNQAIYYFQVSINIQILQSLMFDFNFIS